MGTGCSGQAGECPVGPSSDGAELPWIGTAAEGKQAAGFGSPRIPAAENMSCKQGLLSLWACALLEAKRRRESLGEGKAGWSMS